jgi:hypothetical protein
MTVYTNRLPIHFDKTSILLYEFGDARGVVPALANGRGAFEQGGTWYAIAPLRPQAGLRTKWMNPLDFPDVVVPYLVDRLRALLSGLGIVTVSGPGLQFTDAQGNGWSMQVEVDWVQQVYCLVVEATVRTTASTEHYLFHQLVKRLVNVYLPDSQAKVSVHHPTSAAHLQPPELIFRSDGVQHTASARDGLLLYGPYGRKTFAKQAGLKVLVIGRQDHASSLSHLVHDLQHGIAGVNAVAQIWGRPWHETFRFDAAVFESLTVEAYKNTDSPQKIEAIIGEAQASGHPFDLVLYEAEKTAANLEAHLMRKGIPFHLLVPSELEREGVDRANLLLDLGLVLYAKAGGQPWLLPLRGQMDHQLVIGVGSQSTDDGVIGYATVFSSHGNYRLGNAQFYANAAEWAASLGNFVKEQLLHLGKVQGWAKGAKVKLTFHLDQPWPAAQIDLVRATLKERFGPHYDLHLAFLHLTYDHPYRLWSVSDDPTVLLEEAQCPVEGTKVRLNAHQYMIQLVDPDLPRAADKPLLVTLLEGSNNDDLGFQVSEIFSFASLSWRSVERATLPATLEYGKLIAAKGSQVLGADALAQLPEKFHSIPWYL